MLAQCYAINRFNLEQSKESFGLYPGVTPLLKLIYTGKTYTYLTMTCIPYMPWLTHWLAEPESQQLQNRELHP